MYRTLYLCTRDVAQTCPKTTSGLNTRWTKEKERDLAGESLWAKLKQRHYSLRLWNSWAPPIVDRVNVILTSLNVHLQSWSKKAGGEYLILDRTILSPYSGQFKSRMVFFIFLTDFFFVGFWHILESWIEAVECSWLQQTSGTRLWTGH